MAVVIKVINNYAHRLRYDEQMESCSVKYANDYKDVTLVNDWRVRNHVEMEMTGSDYYLIAQQLRSESASHPPIDFKLPVMGGAKFVPRPEMTAVVR